LDFSQPTILVTLHPETVNLDANESNVKEVCETLALLSGRYQVVITLPNADTQGALLRRYFEDLAQGNENIHTLESFGKMGYFAAMRYCSFLLGNTSSGLLEAPSFGKYAVNIGQRQAGRARSANVIDVSARREDILKAVEMIEARDYCYEGDNVYVISPTAGADILKTIKTWKKGVEAGGYTINAPEKESSHE
jgi:GDP/UDP-N,N'-diacetylbacillosamine 2-epimerase (hydrolysing)